MKRVVALFFLSFTLFSCTNNIPKEIQDFLSKIILKEEDVKTGHLIQSFHEEVNGNTGDNSVDFVFNRNSDLDFNFKAVYSYSGTQIKDNVVSKIVELKYTGDKLYQFNITTNDIITTTTIDNATAHGYYYQIFDKGGNVYRLGILYYGDLIAAKANQFYSKYTLNDTRDCLTFTEIDAEYVPNILTNQTITIDQKGMLTFKEEFARSKEVETNITKLTQTATYKYN